MNNNYYNKKDYENNENEFLGSALIESSNRTWPLFRNIIGGISFCYFLAYITCGGSSFSFDIILMLLYQPIIVASILAFLYTVFHIILTKRVKENILPICLCIPLLFFVFVYKPLR
jgi:hypothetical protein